MSGLLERIARRRRASATGQLAPAPAELDTPRALWGHVTPLGPVNGNGANGHGSAGNGHGPAGNGHGPAGNGHGPAGNGHAESATEYPVFDPDTHESNAVRVVSAPPWLTIARQVAPPEDVIEGEAIESETGETDALDAAADEPAPEPVSPHEANTVAQPDADAVADPIAPGTDEAAELAKPEAATAAPTTGEAVDPARASLLERGRIRRRILYLRGLRELHMRDLGGFMLELRRFDAARPELVDGKLDAAAAVDQELRALERVLEQGSHLGEVRLPGIGGACDHCGAVHGSSDRYCAGCGRSLTRRPASQADGDDADSDAIPDEA